MHLYTIQELRELPEKPARNSMLLNAIGDFWLAHKTKPPLTTQKVDELKLSRVLFAVYLHRAPCSLYFITSKAEEGQGSFKFQVCELMLWLGWTLRDENRAHPVLHTLNALLQSLHKFKQFGPQTRNTIEMEKNDNKSKWMRFPVFERNHPFFSWKIAWFRSASCCQILITGL